MAPFRKLLVRNTHFKIKTMAKFRKKPVVIDAVQWTGVNHLITSTFMAGSGATLDYTESALGVRYLFLHISRGLNQIKQASRRRCLFITKNLLTP